MSQVVVTRDAGGKYLSAVRHSYPSGTNPRCATRFGRRLLVTGSIQYTVKFASAATRRRRKSKTVHAQRPDQIPPRAFHASGTLAIYPTTPRPRWYDLLGNAPQPQCQHKPQGRQGPKKIREEREPTQRTRSRYRCPAQSALPVQRGQPAHQRKPRSRHRLARGGRQRPGLDRFALRGDHHARRFRAASRIRHLRDDAGGPPGAGEPPAGRPADLQVSQQLARAAPDSQLPRLHRGTGPI